MKKLFLICVSSVLICGSALATPVLFTLQSLTGTVNNRSILVTPDTYQNPLVIGTNLVSLAPFYLYPTNGSVTTNLAAWGYSIRVDGWPRSAHINVADGTNTVAAYTLINTNAFSPLQIFYSSSTNINNATGTNLNVSGAFTGSFTFSVRTNINIVSINNIMDVTGNGFNPKSNSIAFSFDAFGTNDSSVNIGYQATGTNSGIAIGSQSQAWDRGVSIGVTSFGKANGVAIGYQSIGNDNGVGIGFAAEGSSYGIGIGSGAWAYNGGIAIGANAQADDSGGPVDPNVGNIAIGSDPAGGNGTPATILGGLSDTTEIGRGKATVNGWFHYRGNPVLNQSGQMPTTNLFGIISNQVTTTTNVTAKYFTITGTTNQVVFSATNTPPVSTNLVVWISVQIAGDTNRYRLGLAK
jgi:hypothetical protein